MKKRSLITFLIALMTVILLSVGCSSTSGTTTNESDNNQENKQKSVTLLYSFTPKSLDPHTESIAVRAGITETLVKIDDQLQIQPWLAESWEQLDEKTWKFRLRDGVTFHDGSVMDGDSVKKSFERALEVSKALQNLLKVESIEASGLEITFRTTGEYPAFLSELVHTSASVAQVNADNIEQAPIGTGPFKVTAFRQDVEIQLDRYEQYWDGLAKLNSAIVKFNTDGNVRALSLQSNEADIAYHLPPESLNVITNSDYLRVESIPSLRVHFILYNSTKPQLQDVKVRKALDAIINRPIIANEIMNGHATSANGPFNPSLSFGSDNPFTEFNPERARMLLREAGYELNTAGKMEKDGETLSLKLATYSARPELPLIAQYVQAEATKIGVDIDILTVDSIDSYLYDEVDEWDMVTYSNLTAPRGDGGYFFNVAYLPDGALNPGQVNILELNILIEKLNRTSKQEQRDQLQKQAAEIIQEQIPQSFIVFPHIIVGINERVINWSPGAEEYYMITNTLDVK